MRRGSGLKGFTLIELMIVVAIIGILVSISAPAFIRMQCRSKQTEAKSALKAMYLVEVAYSGEFGGFLNLADLTNFGGLDPRSVNASRFYEYTLVTANGGAEFTADATDARPIINTGTVDWWQIYSQDTKPINLTDRCTAP